MRTNIELDDSLIEEAFRLTDVQTEAELIHLALQEFVRLRQKKNLLDLAGQIQFRDDYDYKAMREVRDAAD